MSGQQRMVIKKSFNQPFPNRGETLRSSKKEKTEHEKRLAVTSQKYLSRIMIGSSSLSFQSLEFGIPRVFHGLLLFDGLRENHF